MREINIRLANTDDAGLVLRLIRELAVYERAPEAVVATEADLERHGFAPDRQFEAILAFLDGEPAGLALFHARFSTWLGRPGMYLEDLYVTEAARGLGVGPPAYGPPRRDRGRARLGPDRLSGARLEPGARLLPSARDAASGRMAALWRRRRRAAPPRRAGSARQAKPRLPEHRDP